MRYFRITETDRLTHPDTCTSRYPPPRPDILNTLQKAFRLLCPLPSLPAFSVMITATGARGLLRSLNGLIAT